VQSYIFSPSYPSTLDVFGVTDECITTSTLMGDCGTSRDCECSRCPNGPSMTIVTVCSEVLPWSKEEPCIGTTGTAGPSERHLRCGQRTRSQELGQMALRIRRARTSKHGAGRAIDGGIYSGGGPAASRMARALSGDRTPDPGSSVRTAHAGDPASWQSN